jgi:hypothetical protein
MRYSTLRSLHVGRGVSPTWFNVEGQLIKTVPTTHGGTWP